MTRFDEVARLRELVGRRAAIIERERDPRSPNYGILERIEIENDIRNVSPWLLEAAACFQPGDAHALGVMSTFFSIPRDGMTLADYEKWLQWSLILIRLQKAAKILEERE